MAEATLLITGTRLGTGAVIRRFDPHDLERHRAVPAPADQGSDEGVELVASGRAVTMDIRVIAPESREELPEGHVGEIWVAGGSVTLGYWQREDITEETYGAHTSAGEGPLLRTGDLGFILDGYLYVTGRLKDVIIVNGRNLYPQDIEEAARVHPAVGAGAAFGIDSGEEQVVLVQEIRHTALGDLTLEDLAARIMVALARSLGIRANVVLVDRGTVVKTTSGKIKRRHMRELFLNGEIVSLHAELDPEMPGLRAHHAGPGMEE
jgi:acyl-CoA synthetase (AMP-forming)/AMP-acid ligase II